MKTPTKPIEKVFIEFRGDPSVGIWSSSFIAEVWIDPRCIAEEDVEEWLEDIRKGFVDVYECLGDEKPVVRFDYEFDDES